MHGVSQQITRVRRLALLVAATMLASGQALCRGADDAGGAAGAGKTATKPAADAREATGPATSRPSTRPVTSRPAAPASRPSGEPKGGGEFWRDRQAGSAGGTLWRLLAYVVVILVLGAAALVVTKKFLPRLRMAGGQELAVAETVHLAPRVTVHLVRVGGRRFMVGATRERISMLAEVTGTFPDIAEVAEQMERGARAPMGEEEAPQ